jgi:hypothetical protein
MHRRGVLRIWNRAKLKLAVACLTALGTLVVGVGVAASAEPVYAYLCGEATAPAFCSGLGEYHEPFGVAVDNSGGAKNGDVYIVSIGVENQSSVGRFTPFGEPDEFTGTNSNITGASKNFLVFPRGPSTVGAVGVAVDSSGNFYVTTRETEPNTVEKFSPEGEPVPAGTFTLPGGFNQASGIAIDNSGGPSNGDIWVGDASTHVVDKFSPAGAKLAEITIPTEGQPYSLAVDTHGNLFLANDEANTGGDVKKYSESGSFVSTLDSSQAQAVAVDPSTEHIFVVDNAGSQIQPYEANGTALTPFGSGTLSNFSVGIGISKSNHLAYVSDLLGNRADLYGSGEPPLTPVTTSPEVTGTSVKLHGELNPGGQAGEAGYHFAYNAGATCEGGSVTPSASIAEAKEALVEAEVEGLTPNTAYKFCLVSNNPFGSAPGNELEFTTEAGKPVVEAQSAEEETKTSAKVLATINPSGASTTCKVEYGLTNAYGSEKACPATPALESTGTTGVPVSVTLTGLEPGSEYHYRFVANNEKGAGSREEDATFATKPLIEGKILAASSVAAESATLNGEITSGAEGASYQFEYGTESVSEHKTPLVTFEHETAGGGFEAISAAVSGLVPGKTYHVRLVEFAIGSETALEGGVTEFTTLLAKPAIEEVSSEKEARHTASLRSKINPKNSETAYYFEYATAQKFEETGAYNHFTATGTIPAAEAGTSPVSVGPVALSELEPGTEYHYRLVATNGGGTADGPDATFETEEPLLPFVISVFHGVTSPTSAVLGANVELNGLPTIYTLEVGTELDQHGTPIYSTPTFGAVPEDGALSFSLTGLLPGTLYHFRVIVHNEDGTFTGADHTFETPGFPQVILPPPPVQIIPTPPLEEVKVPTVVTHEETRAQKYKKAVKLCEKKPNKKRAKCLSKAKKRFGPAKKKGKKK